MSASWRRGTSPHKVQPAPYPYTYSMAQAISEALEDAPDLPDELGRRLGLLLFGDPR